jgi:predicted SprT family Zn-dependent metalloprotease
LFQSAPRSCGGDSGGGAAAGSIHGFSVRVELSTKVIDDTYKLTQTLCHELCHVAAWVVNGTRKPPHGAAFKMWAALAAKRSLQILIYIYIHIYTYMITNIYICVT